MLCGMKICFAGDPGSLRGVAACFASHHELNATGRLANRRSPGLTLLLLLMNLMNLMMEGLVRYS